ncbi:8501_t:CDS:2 [Ambispora leptoticha]|uniref:8501_t:CDS:1 n=1 Tax=Ambispora leptoticha TaxID=144679 RepID=A0A9N8YQ09_9GLOM|nr:8501_t:CDS:2 [Ambispora leptoticha]
MRKLYILHFNDVYHLSAGKQEPVGGAARFATAVYNFREQYDVDKSCVLFSGDMFNPSIESSISKGEHMIPAINEFKIDVACFGNHDFDFGLPNLSSLIKKTNFPWLLSNVVDEKTGESPVNGGKKWHILEKNRLKIAFLGLVEKEWLETIPSLPPTLKYLDFVEVGKELAAKLRDPAGPYAVDLVIALSHSRLPNDIILAKKCQDEIDLVLGGHDHFYYVGKGCEVLSGWTRHDLDGSQEDDGVRVVKSGTDFRELSILEIDVEELDNEDGGTIKIMKNILVTRREITSAISEHPRIAELISQATSSITEKMSKPIAYTNTPWDCRSTTVRTQESGFGNFVADLMLYAYAPCVSSNIDCSLMCGGAIRSDRVYPPGEITLGDILEIFPFEDTLVVVQITGQQLWDALENGFSMVPKQEGRFPIFSGLKVEYNPKSEPGKRLRKVWLTERHPSTPTPLDTLEILPTDEDEDEDESDNIPPTPLNIIGELEMDKIYTVCTRAYMAQGYDGYHSLALSNTKYLVDDENGIIQSTLLRRYFIGLYYVNAMRFNKSCEERTREAVLKAVATWKKFIEKKTANFQHGHHRHLSKRSISDALQLSMGEKITLTPESVGEEAKKEPKKITLDFMKDWVTVAPVIEGRILEVDY